MKKVIFFGGDRRSVTAYKTLENSAFSVESRGLFSGDNGDINHADIIVLPVPTTKDLKTVYCPLTGEKIPLDFIKASANGRPVITANYDMGEGTVDIMKLDGFAYLNAVPTAEGAIAYAIDHTPFTLWKSRVLVIGNGRVAKVLISRLEAFRCHITVSARKFKDFALLDTENIKYIETSKVKETAGSFDIIFNTVDVSLFDSPKELKNALLIDLSSKGCLDFSQVEDTKTNAVKLPAIPGKVAPETAGKIYAKTLKTVINLQI